MATTTREQIAEAALETLRTKGFAGATSRAIARAGGFNQALVFYHYGSLENALLAALDLTSARRMARYRAALDRAHSLDEFVRAARRIYREDEASGHIAVVTQMIAGSAGRPELAGEVLARMNPWIDFCEEAVERLLGDHPLAALLPPRDIARAVTAFYLGANLMTHLDPASGIEKLLGRIQRLASGLSASG
jgi:AcrR family transcriptional regulator